MAHSLETTLAFPKKSPKKQSKKTPVKKIDFSVDIPPSEEGLPVDLEVSLPLVIQHYAFLAKNLSNYLLKATATDRALPILLKGPKGVGKRTLIHLLTLCHMGSLGDLDALAEGIALNSSNRASLLQLWGHIIHRRCSRWIPVSRAPSIMDIRQVHQQLHHYDAGLRFVFLPYIEDLSPQSANCLLKVLEEVPRNTIFFLTTGGGVLPTLYSRCLLYLMTPLAESDFGTFSSSHRVVSNSKSLVSAMAQGCIGAFSSLASHEQWLWKGWEFLQTLPEGKNMQSSGRLFSLGAPWLQAGDAQEDLWPKLVLFWITHYLIHHPLPPNKLEEGHSLCEDIRDLLMMQKTYHTDSLLTKELICNKIRDFF